MYRSNSLSGTDMPRKTVGSDRGGDHHSSSPRTPSPVQFTTGSSKESTPSHGQLQPDEEPLPTFTVTSSPFPPSVAPAPATTTHALNPQAKEFAMPLTSGPFGTNSSATAPLFAMPAHRTSATPAVVTDFTSAWDSGAAFSLGRGLNTNSPPPSTEHAVTQLEAFLRRRYTPECLERREHMVAVFNLEPHTSREALMTMFFPSGCSRALVLSPTDLPPLFATLPLVSRRFAGVVFFPDKHFAMIGIEKVDHFVPNGQHQPLHVIYCGPDATTTSLPGAALPSVLAPDGVAGQLPWMLPPGDLENVNEEMQQRYRRLTGAQGKSMVALHGLDAVGAVAVLRRQVVDGTRALGCEPWPPQQGRVTTQWRCRSISAVVWYPNDALAMNAVRALDGRIPPNQQHALRAFLVPNGSGSSPGSLNSKTVTVTTRKDVHVGSNKGEAAAVLACAGGTEATERADGTRSFTDIHRHFLSTFSDPKIFLVAVHNLDLATDKQRLYKIFYPIGAVDAELFPFQVSLAGKPRRSGVALFNTRGMAEEAAAKINDFVPHGQTRPLLAYCLDRNAEETTESTAAAVERDNETDGNGGSSGRVMRTERTPTTPVSATYSPSSSFPDGASTPRGVPSGASVDELLAAVRRQLRAPSVNATLLAQSMAQIANHPDADDAVADRLAETLSTAIVEMQHHAVKLASSLSGALMTLHELLGIHRRASCDSGARSVNDSLSQQEDDDAPPAADVDEQKVGVVKRIARAMMLLVANSEAPREARNVAAMLCAYLFEFSYLPSSPYAFAARLLSSNEAALREAKVFLGREAGIPTSPATEKKNRPWITLVESLEEMTSLWCRNRSNSGNANWRSEQKKDEHARKYESYINDFYDGSPPRSAGSGKGSVSNSPSCDNLDTAPSSSTANLSGSGKRQSLLTPSSRPTPRRVVTRVSPGNATGSSARAKGLSATADLQAPRQGAGSGLPAPQVVLSPASDHTQGVSADISLESNTAASGGLLMNSLRGLSALPGFQRGLAQAVGNGRPPMPSALAAPASGVAGLPSAGSPLPPLVVTGASGGVVAPLSFQTHRSDCSECTVYITKLPSTFTSGQVHRLLSHFGEFNKVRLCRDEKEGALPGLSAVGSAYNKLCFGFVEFAEGFSAKAMVEYFRNAAHTPNSFEFLRQPPLPGLAPTTKTVQPESTVPFTDNDIVMLRSTRTSQARNPIHDQQRLDAILRVATTAEMQMAASSTGPGCGGTLVRVRACLFGVILPNVSIEEYNEVSQAEPLPTPIPASAPAPALFTVSSGSGSVSGNNLPDVTPNFDPSTAAAAAALPSGLPSHFHDPHSSQSLTFAWNPATRNSGAVFSTTDANGSPPLMEEDDDDDYGAMMRDAVRKMQTGIPDAAASRPAVGIKQDTEGQPRDVLNIVEDDEDDDDDDSKLRGILAQLQL